MPLSRFILRRLLLMCFMLIAVVAVTFFLSRVIPGDPAQLRAGMDATAEEVERMRQRMGLDRPLGEQFIRYVADLLRGDLGTSIFNNLPVLDNLRHFFPATFELALVAMIFAILLGLPLGALSAVRHGSWLDQGLRLGAMVGLAFPSFVLGIVLILIFFYHLDWLPSGRRLEIMAQIRRSAPPITRLLLVDALLAGDFTLFTEAARHLILPAVTLGLASLARLMRFTRASLLEELRQPYTQTARSKGLRPRRILAVHLLRNALIPTVTVMGIAFGSTLSGSVLVETIFNWPGLGQYAFNAVFNLDYPAIVGVTLLTTTVYLFVNLLVDIAYVTLDPRIQFSGAAAT
ncbi:MAG: ABC transporter permease [Anaerolineaceae bacterium]|nr:ABC transporter permease [Anaerolineaceae bacterium]MCY3934780.1 ABC transporter permease [Chloroflexota bacterium]MCY4009934.1 ABC transporter permease [Anaerolineaceae bacterium]MCY4105959.1 ABC transporter permease [Chloroflexota bacterium]